ncbi:hypothetical protein BAC2_02939 [uncultured bacterium]|nr:hypothetical protein BAC2_02939 [uncultured bacterium]
MSKTSTISVYSSTPGLAAFELLRAEGEPWLAECYVPPADFELMAGLSSAVVFGAAGSGKTALYACLRAEVMPLDRPPARLACEWTPESRTGATASSDTVAADWQQILRELSMALIRHVAQWPAGYRQAKDWAKATLRWLAHTSLAKELDSAIAEQSVGISAAGKAALRDLAKNKLNGFLDSASAKGVQVELVKGLGELGLSGACVLVGPESFADRPAPSQNLIALLSTLNLFETDHFAFKFIFPAQFEQSLSAAGAMSTRRIAVHYLHWQRDELTFVVETRLKLASAGRALRLADICQDDQLIEWLSRVGGKSPRGWLEQARPLVAHYLQRLRLGRSDSITAAEWQKIRADKPPRLTLDLTSDEVVAGHRVVDLRERKVELVLLKYLYRNRGHVCTRDELYHKAYYPALYPTGRLESKDLLNEYRDVIDTAIWRLRQEIEPDPKRPLFVVTRKGEGLELRNAW